MSSSSDSNIERARRRINSQNKDSSRNEGSLDRRDTEGIRRRFGHNQPPEGSRADPEPEPEDDSSSFLNKLLGFSLLFCVIAFAFAYFTIGMDSTGVSPEKVEISVTGPQSISAGEVVDLNVSIANQNNVLLQQAELVVDYPAGTRGAQNSGRELTRQRIDLGDISAGEVTQETLSASLFGKQGETREVSVSLEYRVAESNAIFTSSGNYAAEITSSPVSLSVDGPETVTVGEPVSLTVVVESNSSQSISDVVAALDYPFGFEPSETTPEADYRNYVWRLGDLAPGARKTIDITGVFTDTNAESEQSFNAEVGSARIGDATEIGTLFATDNLLATLDEPFINLNLGLSDNSSGEGDSLVNGEISYESNISSLLRGANLTVTISGESVDFSTIESRDGLYRSDQRLIEWNSQTNPELSSVAPGGSGDFSFSLQTISGSDLAALSENPKIDVTAEMTGQAPDSNTLPSPVTASVSKSLSVPTVLSLTADTLYDDGPFDNEGPVPPEVEEETTYTLHLSITNTTNTINDASLSAALPAYVELAGEPEPASSNFQFNEVSGRVSWQIGTIPGGAGYSAAPVEIFIPVSITPNQNQVGETLRLLEDISITGTDTSSEEEIQRTRLNPPTTQVDDLRADYNSGEVEEG